jgi:hypothetical protein
MTQLATKKQHKFGRFLSFIYMFDKSLAVSAPWEKELGWPKFSSYLLLFDHTTVHVWKSSSTCCSWKLLKKTLCQSELAIDWVYASHPWVGCMELAPMDLKYCGSTNRLSNMVFYHGVYLWLRFYPTWFANHKILQPKQEQGWVACLWLFLN